MQGREGLTSTAAYLLIMRRGRTSPELFATSTGRNWPKILRSRTRKPRRFHLEKLRLTRTLPPVPRHKTRRGLLASTLFPPMKKNRAFLYILVVGLLAILFYA